MEVQERITISQELVQRFAEVSGDTNPIHLDASYCKDTQFEKPIAHGMLLASFFSKLIAKYYPGEGSIYLQQKINFLKPCFIGDDIIVKVSLITLNKNKYHLLTQVFNHDDELLVDGDALVLKK